MSSFLFRVHWLSFYGNPHHVSYLYLIISSSQGATQAQWVVPSSPWEPPRRTWSMCGLYMTSLVAMRRTFPSRRGRSSSSWRNRRSSGGAPRAKRDVSGWSRCPTWRNWYDLRPIPANLPMDLATPTATGSPSPPTPSSMPTLSPRRPHHFPLAHLERLSLLYRPCRTAPSWQRPSRNECHAPTIRRLWL